MKKRTTVLAMTPLIFLHGCGGYQSYDECVLGEMKGQQAAMQSTAEKVCERKFPYEKEIYYFGDDKLDIGWSRSLYGGIELEIKSNRTEYRITRVVMNFSKKSCDQSNRNDFSHALSFSFSGNTAVARSAESGEFQCARRSSVYGIIR